MASTVISGRYGSAQRLYPIQHNDPTSSDYKTKGKKMLWQAIDPFAYGGKFPGNEAGTEFYNSWAGVPGTDKYGNALSVGTTASALTSWSLENTIQPVSYTASNTRGFSGKLAGARSATGNMAGIGPLPPVFPGDRFLFVGYTGPSNGKLDDCNGTVYTIAAIANTVTITLNYQLTNPITWQVSWTSDWQQKGDELLENMLMRDTSGNLILSKNDTYTKDVFDEDIPTGATVIKGFWDYTSLECNKLMPSQACGLQFFPEDDDENPSNTACIVDATITFNTEVSPYTNSCALVSGGWQSGVVGATNCTIATNIHGNSYSEFTGGSWLPGSNHKIIMYVEGGELEEGKECDSKSYWEFNKMFLGSFGGLNVDIASNNPTQFSCQMEFNAFPQKSDGSCDKGYILYHDSSTKKGSFGSEYGGDENGVDYYLVSLDPAKQNTPPVRGESGQYAKATPTPWEKDDEEE